MRTSISHGQISIRRLTAWVAVAAIGCFLATNSTALQIVAAVATVGGSIVVVQDLKHRSVVGRQDRLAGRPDPPEESAGSINP